MKNQHGPRQSKILVATVLFVVYSGALFTSPVRLGLNEFLQSRSIAATGDSIVPVLAAVVSTVVLIFRFRFYASPAFRGYAAVATALVGAFLMGEIVRGAPSDLFAYVSALSVVACVLLVGVLNREERQSVLRWVVATFAVYIGVNLVYWLVALDPFTRPNEGVAFRRMGGSLATVVDLGALIPAFAALALWLLQAYHGRRAFLELIVILASLAGSLATGSRTAVAWMGMILIGLALSRARVPRLTRMIAVLVLSSAVILWVGDYLTGTRYVNFTLGSRLDTWTAGMEYWFQQPFSTALFGAGWGEVYPYWSWLSEGGKAWGDSKWFVLAGRRSLVQPHNTVLWYLVEGGLMAALALLGFLLYPIGRILVARDLHAKPLLLVGGFSLVSMFMINDTLITSPRTAILGIIVLLLSGGIDEVRCAVTRRAPRRQGEDMRGPTRGARR